MAYALGVFVTSIPKYRETLYTKKFNGYLDYEYL